jgi:hypothetical protein
MRTEDVLRLLPLLIPLLVIQVGLIVVALLDLARREHTRGPKWAWVLVIVLLEMLGPVVYFVFGRREE